MNTPAIVGQIVEIPIASIIPGNNDRKKFAREGLEALGANIRQHGLTQPVTLRPLADGSYRIVAGERRFRTYRDVLAWPTIPAIVKDLSREAESAAMLAENTGRIDLSPIEEANAYSSRIEEFGWTVEECAEAAGVTVKRVNDRLHLLGLRDDLQALVGNGNFTVGFAEILGRSGLDSNFQGRALAELLECKSPSLPWFRRLVGGLVAAQSQTSLFGDGPLFGGMADSAPLPAIAPDPPHPCSTIPPHFTGTVAEMALSHAEFWRRAAEAWDAKGNGDKRRDCLAAAAALDSLRMAVTV